MLKRKDQALLSEAYGQVELGDVSAPSLMGKPVMITMDMPGAEVSDEDDYDDEHHEVDMEEVEMAVSDLGKLSKLAHKLLHMLEDQESLEGWVAAKITKAADYISSVYDYINDEDGESCGCSDEEGMYDKGYEDTDECPYAAAGCKCGGCPDCQ
jgi:hypothetical protein